MHKNTEICNTKQCRKDIDSCLQKVRQLSGSREVSLAITKLQEAIMWLNMNLKQLDYDNQDITNNNCNDIHDNTVKNVDDIGIDNFDVNFTLKNI